MSEQSKASLYRYLAELIGTAILIIIGDMSIASSALAGAPSFGWVVFGWGMAVLLAVYITGGISGAHINPAVTLALAVGKRFPWKDVIPYIIAQIIGAYIGAAIVYITWWGPWEMTDPNRTKVGIASILYCFAPNPGPFKQFYPTDMGGTGEMVNQLDKYFPVWYLFLAEVIMTFFLLLTIVAVNDPDSPMHTGAFAGYLVALYVFIACMIEAPITMTCMNPARDWGPRLFAATIGYGPDFTLWHGEFPLVYGVAQFIGGILGVLFYDYLMRPYYKLIKKK